MIVAPVLLAVATGLYAGFQWTIRVLVYPQFASVPAASFADFEARHQRRVSVAVGPLFGLLAIAAAATLVVRPDVWSALAAACFVAIVLVTGVLAVPLHRRLSTGFDAATHRRLLTVDSARLFLAVLACAAAVVCALD